MSCTESLLCTLSTAFAVTAASIFIKDAAPQRQHVQRWRARRWPTRSWMLEEKDKKNNIFGVMLHDRSNRHHAIGPQARCGGHKVQIALAESASYFACRWGSKRRGVGLAAECPPIVVWTVVGPRMWRPSSGSACR